MSNPDLYLQLCDISGFRRHVVTHEGVGIGPNLKRLRGPSIPEEPSSIAIMPRIKRIVHIGGRGWRRRVKWWGRDRKGH